MGESFSGIFAFDCTSTIFSQLIFSDRIEEKKNVEMSFSFRQPIVLESSWMNSLDRSNEKDEFIVSNILESNYSAQQRLFHQRTKINEFYQREIEICVATEKLIRFLDQIDFLLEQFESEQSNQSFDEENYAEYLKGEKQKIFRHVSSRSISVFLDFTESNDVGDLLAETSPIDRSASTLFTNDHSYSKPNRPEKNFRKKSTVKINVVFSQRRKLSFII